MEMRTTEPAALNRMREIGDKLTPEEAARIIREHYERPDPAVANDAHRMEVARRVYDGRSERPIKKAGAADAAETAKDALYDEGEFFDEDPVRDAETLKKKQLDIILRENPAHDDVHSWIRTTKDIHTAEEVFKEAAENGEAMYPDFTLDMMDEALKSGQVTVYSSYPIKKGNFVTPSYMNARDYAGGGRVYSKKIRLTDVAWIDESEGQYAPRG